MQQSLEEILRSRMAQPVSIKGKEGATVMPMEAIAMLPGWRASRGAQIENYVAFHFPMMGISKAAREEIERIK